MRKLKHENKKLVTVRLEPSLVAALKKLAHKKGMKYQAVMREILWKAVNE
ncbi:CopG family antitoxin [Desulfofundulus thermocisternus]|nr:CopG family antitoxin [Desulfofundulus thermocisternus]